MSKLGVLMKRWLRAAERSFHMLVGIAFLFLTMLGAHVSFNEWLDYLKSPSVGLVRFGLLASFTGLLFLFSLYSFLRARSVR